MKKNLISLILAILIIMSCFLTGCPANEENQSQGEKANKEIFMSAFDNGFFKTAEAKAYNHNGSATITNNEDDSQIKVDFDLNGKDKTYQGKLDVLVAENKMPLEFAIDENDLYYRFVDFMDSYVCDTASDEIIEDSEEVEMPMELAVLMNTVNAANSIAAKLDEEIKGDRLDELFNLAPGSDDTSKIISFDITEADLGKIEGFENLKYTFSIWVDSNGETSKIHSGSGCMSFDFEGKAIELIFDIENNDKTEVNIEIAVDSENIIRGSYTDSLVDGKSNIDAQFKMSFLSDGSIENVVMGFTYNESEENKGKGEISLTVNYTAEGEAVPLNPMKINLPFEYSSSDENSFLICFSKPSIDTGVKTAFDISVSMLYTKSEKGEEAVITINSNLDMLPLSVNLKVTSAPIDNFVFEAPEESNAYDGDIMSQIQTRYPDIYDFLFGFDDDYLDDSGIMVENDYDFYDIADNGTGVVCIGYTTKENSDGKAAIVLDNGKEIQLDYTVGGPTDDDSFKVNINGMDFDVYHSEYNGELSYYLSAAELITIGEYKDTPVTIETYNDLKNGTIISAFTYDVEDNVYTITHQDGTVETRTLAYDEEYDVYYFDDQMPPSERYIDVFDTDIYYTFDQTNKTVFISAVGTVESHGDGKATIIINGQKIDVEYENQYYDDSLEGYLVYINGLEYLAYEYEPSEFQAESEIVIMSEYSCDCENINECNVYISYLPDSGEFAADSYLHFTNEDNEYIIKMPDGNVITKTIIYDEDTEEYYFG